MATRRNAVDAQCLDFNVQHPLSFFGVHILPPTVVTQATRVSIKSKRKSLALSGTERRSKVD
ncbi:hypothetical protein TUMSATVNIG3_56580 (plasmid) [Vibrio nigripulchritudo]|nr:hypothetical protein TUMSATVNIG2_55890 [Vibrio nigripulchritudo]BDU46860.1 hypothetical protein TUMSATVNIG3_56580 [Vibrio nigripulchritudo]